MGWTSERPTEPGWYWLVHHTGDVECVLVEVDYDDPNGGVAFVCADDHDDYAGKATLEPWPFRDVHVSAWRAQQRDPKPWHTYWSRDDRFEGCAWAPAEPPPFEGDL